MKAPVFDLDKQAVGEIELDDAIFASEVREHLFWEVVNWQRAKRRAGTHKTKTRSEVRGGGRKPWKQKGTGRARQGSIRAPHWVGGGVAHGTTPRDYSYRMPKNKRRAALRSALAMKARDAQFFVVDSFSFEAPRTKAAKGVMSAFEAKKMLFVDVTAASALGPKGKPIAKPVHNENLRKSVRNLQEAKYLAAEGLNVEDLLGHEIVVVSRAAVVQIEARLAKVGPRRRAVLYEAGESSEVASASSEEE